ARACRSAKPRRVRRRGFAQTQLRTGRSRNFGMCGKTAGSRIADRQHRGNAPAKYGGEHRHLSVRSSRGDDRRAASPALAESRDQIGSWSRVTCSRNGTDEQAAIAMQSAADLFSVRHVCGFGHDLPDGLVPLDDIFSSEGIAAVSPRIGCDTSAAAITFNLDAEGFVPVSRTHADLVAGGLEIVRKSGAATDAPLLSTIPITSFAGIA